MSVLWLMTNCPVVEPLSSIMSAFFPLWSFADIFSPLVLVSAMENLKVSHSPSPIVIASLWNFDQYAGLVLSAYDTMFCAAAVTVRES